MLSLHRQVRIRSVARHHVLRIHACTASSRLLFFLDVLIFLRAPNAFFFHIVSSQVKSRGIDRGKCDEMVSQLTNAAVELNKMNVQVSLQAYFVHVQTQHTFTHAHLHTHTYTHSHTNTRTHTRKHRHTLINTHKHTNAHTINRTLTHSPRVMNLLSKHLYVSSFLVCNPSSGSVCMGSAN